MRRQPARPAAGRRRRRRRRLPGRHRPDAGGPARARRSRRRRSSTPPRRSPRSRRTSPRSAPARPIPDPSDYSLDGLTDEERQEAIARGGQIFLTNCTACHNFAGAGGAMPRGGYAPQIRGVARQAHLRGDAHRPAGRWTTSPTATCRPRRSATSSPTSSRCRTTPSYGGFGLGGIGPVSEGLFAWLVGIGSLVGVAVWIAAHTARSSKKKASRGRTRIARRRHR